MTAPAVPGAAVHSLSLELEKLGQRVGRQVLKLIEDLERGLILPSQVPELAAVLVKLGADQAATLTVGDLSRELTRAGVPPSGLPPLSRVTSHSTLDGAEQAVRTIMEGPSPERAVRLERLGRASVAQSGQDSRGQALELSPMVEGWYRGLDSDPCQLCRWWFRDGHIWPTSHSMPRHPGCCCVQVPVLQSTR